MIKLERIAVAGFNVDEAIHTKQSPRRNTKALLFLAPSELPKATIF
ncbi:hypothetical protein PMI30_00242 [Pseudomonas sp. GM50]|nr:hypothetical protein [Pseudomonas sp. GM50]EJM71563.1 hypothetical protein PMI30_00242 [Pseudomonas sp. GM50]